MTEQDLQFAYEPIHFARCLNSTSLTHSLPSEFRPQPNHSLIPHGLRATVPSLTRHMRVDSMQRFIGFKPIFP